MKKIIFLIVGVALLLECQAVTNRANGSVPQSNLADKGGMTISCTPDLFDLTSKWVSGFSAIHPNLKIEITGQNGAGMAGSVNKSDLAFVSQDMKMTDQRGAWQMVIGRDAIVPVFNSGNPQLAEICRQGVSAEEFNSFIKNPGNKTWASLLDGGANTPVTYYLIDNQSIRTTVGNFLNLDPASITGMNFATGLEMIAAIQKDPNAIGFCKLADITDPSGQNLLSQISLLPIDRNGNGKMDYFERIYANVTDLTRGIWIGKYPKELCRNLYVSSLVKPTNDNEVAFVKYILTNGQQFLDLTGLNSLSNTERLSKIDNFPSTFLSAKATDGINLTQLLLTILAGMVIVFALVALIIRYKRENRPMTNKTGSAASASIHEGSLLAPKGLLFDKTHTWAFMEKDGTVKVGIDDFLQHVTGPISSIKMKKPGDKVIKGQPILTIIQKGKRLNISAPLSGIIMAENPVLFTDSSLLNSSPYAAGWIYQIEPTNWLRETQFLFMAEKYAEWLKTEFTRLRDFLANAIKSGDPQFAYVILQDGGEITDHVLENFGPEVWEDFQTKFINTSK